MNYRHKLALTAAVYEYTGRVVRSLEYVSDPNTEGCDAIRCQLRGDDADTYNFFCAYHGAPGMRGPYNGFEIEEVEFTNWPPTSGGQSTTAAE